MCVCVALICVHKEQKRQRGGGGGDREAGREFEYAPACMYVEILTLQFGSRGQRHNEGLGAIHQGELSKEDVTAALHPPLL